MKHEQRQQRVKKHKQDTSHLLEPTQLASEPEKTTPTARDRRKSGKQTLPPESALTPTQLIETGVKHFQEGDYLPACKFFSEAVKQEQNNSDVWLRLGICCIELEKYSEAIDALLKATELDRYNAHAFYLQGKALEAMGRYTEAEKEYKMAASLDSHFGAAIHAVNRVIEKRIFEELFPLDEADETTKITELNRLAPSQRSKDATLASCEAESSFIPKQVTGTAMTSSEIRSQKLNTSSNISSKLDRDKNSKVMTDFLQKARLKEPTEKKLLSQTARENSLTMTAFLQKNFTQSKEPTEKELLSQTTREDSLTMTAFLKKAQSHSIKDFSKEARIVQDTSLGDEISSDVLTQSKSTNLINSQNQQDLDLLRLQLLQKREAYYNLGQAIALDKQVTTIKKPLTYSQYFENFRSSIAKNRKFGTKKLEQIDELASEKANALNAVESTIPVDKTIIGYGILIRDFASARITVGGDKKQREVLEQYFQEKIPAVAEPGKISQPAVSERARQIFQAVTGKEQPATESETNLLTTFRNAVILQWIGAGALARSNNKKPTSTNKRSSTTNKNQAKATDC